MKLYSVFWGINDDPPITTPENVREAHQQIKPYITDFLTSRHPFRSGVVCPFVPKSVKDNSIYLTYCSNTTDADIDSTINDAIGKLTISGHEQGLFCAVIILFDQTYPLTELLKAHIRNKVKCVESFLMIGALYPTSMAASLHADEFFPLRTPMPTLVLRGLTPSDLIFLDPIHYEVNDRIMFLESYISKFSTSQSLKDLEQVLLAKEMLSKYKHGKNQ
jgi:hypothetical protein